MGIGVHLGIVAQSGADEDDNTENSYVVNDYVEDYFE